MLTQNTILVAVGFGETDRRTLDVAHDLGRRLGTRVVLLHVFEPPIFSYPEMPMQLEAKMFEELSACARKALDELAAVEGGLPSILRFGDPAAQILKVIEETHPALVVMGTHGRRGVERLLLGSVAERVVRQSRAPVLTVHAPLEAANAPSSAAPAA